MPKVNTNSHINYFQTPGRVIQHDLWMDQSVTQNSTPTFGNLFVSGDTEINGNLYVYGNTSIFNTNITEFEDNILLINRAEIGPGVTLGLSGIEIGRGPTQDVFRAVFRESDDSFRIGFINSTQAVATREDLPLDKGLAVWNDSVKRFDSKTSIDLPINFNNTQNAVSITTGSIRASGGVSISRDLYIEGKVNYKNNASSYWDGLSNELSVTSTSRIALRPTTDIFIPINTNLTWGNDQNWIKIDASSNLITNVVGNVNITPGTNKGVIIPNNNPVMFGSESDNTKKIYGESSGNLVLTSGLDMQLSPGRNIVIPSLTPITFGAVSQRIFSNAFSDLVLSSNNNILLNPVSGLDVVIPQESGTRYGSVARIWSSPSNSLLINSTGLIVTSGTFKLENGTSLFIGQTELKYNTTGSGKIQVLGTMEIPNMIITNISTGSLDVTGNSYIKGNMVIDGNLNVNGTTTTIDTQVSLIKDNLIVVNSGPSGLADSGILMKRYSDGVSNTVGNIYAGVVYQESSDQIVLGYTTTDPGTGAVLFSDYIPLKSDRITIVNTSDSDVNTIGSSLLTYGGAFISKNLRIGNDIYLPETGSIWFNGNTAGSFIKSRDSGTDLELSGLKVFITGTTDATITNTLGSMMVSGGQYISKNLRVDGNIFSQNTGGHRIGNLIFENNLIKGTNGTTVSFPDGFYTKNMTLENYSLSQINGQLTLSGTSSTSSGLVVSTDFLDILGQTTITDYLEIIESPLFLNSGVTSFKVNPTGNSLQISSDLNTGPADLEINNLNVNITNSSGSHQITFEPKPTTSNLIISNGIYTKFDDQINMNGELFVKINNTSGSSSWYLLEGLETYSQFNMTVDDSFHFKKGVGINDFSYTYLDEQVPLRVYQDLTFNYYYLSINANSLRNIRVWNKAGDSTKLTITYVNSLPGTNLIYSTDSATDINASLPDLELNVGDIYSYGSEVALGDLKPIIGYRNSDTTGNSKIGIALERSRQIVSDTQSPIYTLVLPSQTGVITSNQIKFGVTGPTDDLTGAVLKIGELIYRIKIYNPTIKVATIEGIFVTSPVQNEIVTIYDKAFIDFVYNESSDQIELRYTPVEDTNLDPYCSLRIGELNVTRNTVLNKNLTVNSTDITSSTTSGSLVVLGGVGVDKNLFVRESLTITGSSGSNSGTVGGVHLTNRKISGLDFFDYKTNLTVSNGTNGGLYMNSLGNIGIHTTAVSSNVTLKANDTIGIDNQNGFLNLLDRIKLYGNNLSKVEISSGSLITNEGCGVTILNTVPSNSNTSGALVVGGGLTVSGSTNSISSSVGGALTVAGGASVSKDLYVGGNLVITGSIELTGAVTTPTVTIDSGSLVNCNIGTIVYSKLVKLSLNYTLQICIEVNPNAAYTNTELQFTLPGRIDNFTKRTDTFTTSSGWTDNLNVIPLNNIVSCGVPGTQRVLVKFQSISTNTHYLQIMCMYNEF